MKIVHLIYTKAVAGAEKYLLNLLPGLQQYNIACTLICVGPISSVSVLSSYCDMMRSKGIKTMLLTGGKKKFLSIAGRVNQYLKDEKISIIHSHLLNADLIAVLVKIIYNKNLFLISGKHGYDENYLVKYNANADKHKIDRNFYYYFTKFLLSKIDKNLSVSKALSNLYFDINLTAEPYSYIHHGTPEIIENYTPDKKIPNQIIIAGRLEKMKGHTFLLDAFAHVISIIPDARLLILGDGSEKMNLERQSKELGIDKKIKFMGFKAEPEKYIIQSEVIILPAIFEPFGLVYIEAFALKVPVVAFDVPAANELIIDNKNGLLVPKFNSEILAQKIIYLLQNSNERKRISENAYKIYLENYTAEKMITKTVNWYKSLSIHSN